MKTEEVLKRYAAGERNFRRVNLRGQSFKGKDLSGADFSEADIRGADFTNAYLKGAKFCGAKAGLSYFWIVSLVLCSLVVATLTGVASGQIDVASIALSFQLSHPSSFFPTITICFILIFFLISLIQYGLRATFIVLAFSLSLAWILTWVGTGIDKTEALALALGWTGCWVGLGSLAESLMHHWSWLWLGAGALVWSIAGLTQAYDGTLLPVIHWFLAGVLAWILGLLGVHVSRQAFAGQPKFTEILLTTRTLGAIGGTSFRHADLTDADFSWATLKSTDFRHAILTRIYWHNTQKLDRIRPGTTYLQDTKVRQLLITGYGQEQNFDRKNLRGVNLQSANLTDASFIGADLSEANLQDADLSRAKLVQTQLDEADLTGATLTGATIEDWNITSHTQLQGIRCRWGNKTLSPRQEYRNRQALLTKVKNFWVKGVLEKSLYNQVLIELGLEERADAIANPWNVIIETGDSSSQPLPEGTKVIDIFDQIGTGRTLLILGEPGSGKTTTLLELTRDLIVRAEQNDNLLIPVVFNLSSWANKRPMKICPELR